MPSRTNKSRVIGVIPARWASTRFEGKILALLQNRPLIQHVWVNAQKSQRLDDLFVACDDERIKDCVTSFGGKAVMTSKGHASGTDRIVEAVKGLSPDIVINIQGDEPMIDPMIIDALAEILIEDKKALVTTAVKKIENEDEIDNPNVVKCVLDNERNALYFSRAVIPYNREATEATYFKHLGIYGYTINFLRSFHALPESKLEQIEKLEQLRILEAGVKIRTVETKHETIGVDTEEDLKRVEEILAERELCKES